MQRAQYRVSLLAHAAQAPHERRGEQARKDLVEHPCQRGEDQPEPRGDDGQRGQRARETRVAKHARDDGGGQRQQHHLDQSAQQHGGHAGHEPRERPPAPIVHQRHAERQELKGEQQSGEPGTHLREYPKLVDEYREDQRPGGRRNRRGEAPRRHDAGEQRHGESDQAIEDERPPRGEQGEEYQAGQQRAGQRDADRTPRDRAAPRSGRRRLAQSDEQERGQSGEQRRRAGRRTGAGGRRARGAPDRTLAITSSRGKAMAPCRQIGTSSMVRELGADALPAFRDRGAHRVQACLQGNPVPERDEQLVAARPQSIPGRGDLGAGRLGPR